MTDKEQIIIDSVDVSKCKHFPLLMYKDHPKWTVCHEWGSGECRKRPDCCFKQLARKTQECEELEELLKLRTNDRIDKLERAIIRRNAKIDRYRKALEEIEKEVHDEMCDTLGHLCAYCDGKHSCITLKILDIISRAKGGRK